MADDAVKAAQLRWNNLVTMITTEAAAVMRKTLEKTLEEAKETYEKFAEDNKKHLKKLHTFKLHPPPPPMDQLDVTGLHHVLGTEGFIKDEDLKTKLRDVKNLRNMVSHTNANSIPKDELSFNNKWGEAKKVMLLMYEDPDEREKASQRIEGYKKDLRNQAMHKAMEVLKVDAGATEDETDNALDTVDIETLRGLFKDMLKAQQILKSVGLADGGIKDKEARRQGGKETNKTQADENLNVVDPTENFTLEELYEELSEKIYIQSMSPSDDEGRKILHTAAKLGNADLVKVLILNGEKLNEADHERKMPLDYAIMNSNQDVIDVLLANGATRDFTKTSEEYKICAEINGIQD